MELTARNVNCLGVIDTVIGKQNERAARNGKRVVELNRIILCYRSYATRFNGNVICNNGIIVNIQPQAAGAANGQVAHNVKAAATIILVTDAVVANELDNDITRRKDKCINFIAEVGFCQKAAAAELVIVEGEHTVLVVSVAARYRLRLGGFGSTLCKVVAVEHSNTANVNGCAPLCCEGNIGKNRVVIVQGNKALTVAVIIIPTDERQVLGVRNVLRQGQTATEIGSDLCGCHCAAAFAKIKG